MQETVILFKEGDHCVYKTHGVGKITRIESIKIGNYDNTCYIIFFEREKLTVSVPVTQTIGNYLRKISCKEEIENALEILRNGSKKIKGMWSRRAKEYEEKINSGDILLIAEVLRDLTRDIEDADRSFSERMIYETAIYRLASEYRIIHKTSLDEATRIILEISKEKINFADLPNVQEQA